MQTKILRLALFPLIFLTLPLTAMAQVVDIPDSNLRAAIEEALGKASGATITTADMARLRHFDARNANISNLTGLEAATNLTSLSLGDKHVEGQGWINSNSIKDLSPLAELSNLTSLNLSQNNISDLSPLAELSNLTWLDVGGNNLSNLSPVAELINLTALRLWRNNIVDVSPVADLIDLTELNLSHNNIKNVSPVAGLTDLTRLSLAGNSISDISPLVVNAGLGSGDTVNVKGNPLNRASIETHIPALQGRGVTIEFDDRLPPSINTNGMVRLVYFLPSDRPARPDRVAALRQLIKDAQQFYADEMHRHGFGGKTFTVETDANGVPVVHQVDGQFTNNYYYTGTTDFKVWDELLEHFTAPDALQHVYFIAIDLSYEALNDGQSGGLGGVTGQTRLRHRYLTAGDEIFGGFALIPAFGRNFERLGLTVHELGHAFALAHDFRQGRHSDYVMGFGNATRLSKCAAEWLSVSRFFNAKTTFQNEPGEIKLLSVRAYSQDVINLRFEVADPDVLHQAQVLVPEILNDTGWGPFQLFDCKRLNGKTGVVEFTVRTAELVDRVTLQAIDVGGNIAWATFPIQLDEAVPTQNILDVNNDGVVNLSDLIPFASRFGQRGKDKTDVNEDGVVDIVDVLLVASFISSLPRQTVEMFTSADVQQWLSDARALDVENEILEKGIFVLEHLLAEIDLLSQPMTVTTGQLKATLEGHTDAVWDVTFSPDGQTLASGSRDSTSRLWNPNTAQRKNLLIGHTHTVSVAFSPNGSTLASGSWDKTIRLWNIDTGKLKRILSAPRGAVASVMFSPDGEFLASGGDYSTLLLWDTTTWQVTRELTGHTGIVESVVFSLDGGILASGSRDGTIRLWNPNTGNYIRTLPATSPVNRLAFSPDGGTLASGSWDKTIRLWNPHTGQLKRTLQNQGGWVNAVAFSPDGKTLAIGNRGISLWDIETGQYKEPLAEDIGDAVSLVFSPDGQTLASGSSDGKVRLYDFIPFLITPGLSKISGDNQTGVSGGVLTNPFVVKVRDENLSVLEGIVVTFTVTAGDGTLSVTHTTTDKNGRADSTLTLGLNLGTNTVSVSAAGIKGTVTFNSVAETAVDIPDSNLRAAIGDALNKAPDTPIAPAEIATLPRLEARNRNISNLTGLEGATNLTHLRLHRNAISDISPVAELTNLTVLEINDNNISDISPVANLINLKHFELPNNNVSDISAVSGLTNLTVLNLGGNAISDISPVAGLTRLKRLMLSNNAISDVSPLLGLNLIGLPWDSTGLYIEDNPLSYQSIHTHIPALQSRGVTVEYDVDGTRPPDVNGDGNLDVLDLIAVTSYFGDTGENITTDVSGDGVVDVLDLVLVAGSFDGTAAAPSAQSQIPEALTAVEVRGWLTDAKALENRDSIMQRGILVLEQLLVYLTPKETELLANYPNPFNPETWIPYRLAEDGFVTLTIYDTAGQVIRTLNLGHQIASAYESRSKAVFWDGRNQVGEQVSSGVYFYHLSAGDYSNTRKMLILK